MTKLKPTHFYDPEPKEKDFLVDSSLTNPMTDQSAYSKAHSAWKARNVKPDCVIIFEEERGAYEKALQHYEENRRRYDGFEKWGEDEKTINLGIKGDNDFDLVFYKEKEYVFIENKDLHLSFENGLSISLFEQIAKENGIELRKL